jgi:hypothetical protein
VQLPWHVSNVHLLLDPFYSLSQGITRVRRSHCIVPPDQRSLLDRKECRSRMCMCKSWTYLLRSMEPSKSWSAISKPKHTANALGETGKPQGCHMASRRRVRRL